MINSVFLTYIELNYKITCNQLPVWWTKPLNFWEYGANNSNYIVLGTGAYWLNSSRTQIL